MTDKKLRNSMIQELEILVGGLEASPGARKSFMLVKKNSFGTKKSKFKLKIFLYWLKTWVGIRIRAFRIWTQIIQIRNTGEKPTSCPGVAPVRSVHFLLRF
jgi:hypothetical protein